MITIAPTYEQITRLSYGDTVALTAEDGTGYVVELAPRDSRWTMVRLGATVQVTAQDGTELMLDCSAATADSYGWQAPAVDGPQMARLRLRPATTHRHVNDVAQLVECVQTQTRRLQAVADVAVALADDGWVMDGGAAETLHEVNLLREFDDESALTDALRPFVEQLAHVALEARFGYNRVGVLGQLTTNWQFATDTEQPSDAGAEASEQR